MRSKDVWWLVDVVGWSTYKEGLSVLLLHVYIRFLKTAQLARIVWGNSRRKKNNTNKETTNPQPPAYNFKLYNCSEIESKQASEVLWSTCTFPPANPPHLLQQLAKKPADSMEIHLADCRGHNKSHGKREDVQESETNGPLAVLGDVVKRNAWTCRAVQVVHREGRG